MRLGLDDAANAACLAISRALVVVVVGNLEKDPNRLDDDDDDSVCCCCCC